MNTTVISLLFGAIFSFLVVALLCFVPPFFKKYPRLQFALFATALLFALFSRGQMNNVLRDIDLNTWIYGFFLGIGTIGLAAVGIFTVATIRARQYRTRTSLIKQNA